MKQPRIVIGQKVSNEKKAASKELKRNMTPAEKALWANLRGNRLKGYHFRRQQIIAGFIVDFYCHEVGLVIEVDGNVHESQIESDEERSNILRAMGLKVMRFSNDQVICDSQAAISEISQFLPPSRVGKGARGLG